MEKDLDTYNKAISSSGIVNDATCARGAIANIPLCFVFFEYILCRAHCRCVLVQTSPLRCCNKDRASPCFPPSFRLSPGEIIISMPSLFYFFFLLPPLAPYPRPHPYPKPTSPSISAPRNPPSKSAPSNLPSPSRARNPALGSFGLQFVLQFICTNPSVFPISLSSVFCRGFSPDAKIGAALIRARHGCFRVAGAILHGFRI